MNPNKRKIDKDSDEDESIAQDQYKRRQFNVQESLLDSTVLTEFTDNQNSENNADIRLQALEEYNQFENEI